MTPSILRWRRLDTAGVEVLRFSQSSDGFRATSTVEVTGADPFSVIYDWQLDSLLSTRSLMLEVKHRATLELRIERTGTTTWRIDGQPRPDLDGCEEIDLSITPFSNTLALRRFGPTPGGAGEVVALFVELPALTCVPSRQRYEQLGPNRFKYVDLGAYRGFEAEVGVDAEGFVEQYAGLFERLDVAASP